MLFCAAAALSLGALISRLTMDVCDVFAVTAFQMMLGGGIMLLGGWMSGGAVSIAEGAAAGRLVYLVMAPVVSFCLWAFLLKRFGVGKVAIYNFLMPVLGVILSGVLLSEEIWNGRVVLALMLACCGIFVAGR